MAYDKLFQPIKIGNTEIKNRLIMSPMGTLINEPGGEIGDRTYKYFEARAKGGMGLLCTEICRYNDKEGASAWTQMTMSDDRYIASFANMAEMIHSYGAKIFVQLQHPGRQNQQAMVLTNPMLEKLSGIYGGAYRKMYDMNIRTNFLDPDEKEIKMNKLLPPLKSASAIPADLGMSHTKGQHVKALSKKEIAKLVEEHSAAAERVMQAGGDGVIIHAASGYLVQQFLSPHTNKREDEYGGSYENRLRFIRELIDGVREKCGKDFPISVRLCVDEMYELIGLPGEGITRELGIQLAKSIAGMGIDLLDITTGNYETFISVVEPVSYPTFWKKDLIKTVHDAVREVSDVPITAVNVIRRPEDAEKLIEEGVQEMVSLGRATLADPEWANKAHDGRDDEIAHCISCMGCLVSQENAALKNEGFMCSMNPRCLREYEYPLEPERDGEGKRVVVAGAGPAGLTAARELAKRGFETIVLEKNKYAGGQMYLASKPPHREKMQRGVDDLERLARLAGADIRYGVKADAEAVMALDPYAVLICTGGGGVIPRSIPGIDRKNVYGYESILDGSVKLKNKKIVLVGSAITGLEVADYLTDDPKKGNEVTLVDMVDMPARGEYRVFRWEVIPKLEERGVKFKMKYKLVKIDDDGVCIENIETHNRELLKADAAVIAVGVKSENSLADELGDKVRHSLVGFARETGHINEATHDAFIAARSLV